MSEKTLTAPVISIPSGNYNKTCFVEIKCDGTDCKILYSTDGSTPQKVYPGPFAVRASAKVRALCEFQGSTSEESLSDIIITKEPAKRGSVVIIGGAEHCKEIHEKIVELGGGKDKARIAFLPTSSADPYSAGMDRVTRFKDLGGMIINENEVPMIDGKHDYSSMGNKSSFWIMPVAIMDDEFTGNNIQDDPDTPLTDESTFPNIDEATWLKDAYDISIAEKLRDGGYNIVFLTGGNQARYLECLYYNDYTESPVLSIIREILEERGGVIAGTSAGAAVLSEVMIQGGGSYGATLAGVIHQDIDLVNYSDEYTPFTDVKDGRVWIGRGFGFLPNHIISGTHFVARGRIGRLLTAAKYLKGVRKKSVTGIGVDEDTAVVVYPDNRCEVVGALGALILDTHASKAIKANRGLSTFSDPFIMHYLEHGDIFYIDPETGKTEVQKINPAKKLITKPDNKKYYLEPDIFGHNCIRDFTYNCLIQSDAHCAIGTEIIDNTESSYDSILFHDLVKEDTILFRFHKNEKTAGYEGTITYHWFGKGEKDYPRLRQENETGRFSFHDVYAEIMRLDVMNFPDLSDSSDVPLKMDYLKDGYTEEEWQDMFDSRKNYRLGMILIPDKDKTEVFTFFLDYAYFNYSRNGRYSPPRLSLNDPEGTYKDYDIVQMSIAPGAEIYLDDKLVGNTDDKGILIMDTNKWDHAKVIFKGKRTEYVIQTQSSEIRESILVFEEIDTK